MEAYLPQFLVLLFLQSVVTFPSQLRLEAFEQCLISQGIYPNNFVRRSNSSEYGVLNHQWQDAVTEILPAGYVIVQNESDITVTVNCGRRENIRLVPKGGGHSWTKYSFGDSNSVIVDLRAMNEIVATGDQVQIGAGTLVGPLTWKLYNETRRYFATGFCPNVGISGLATGGGLGLFTRHLGLTHDALLEAKLVTADGNLLTVNANNHSDLFWALRGGGGASFGIVTSLAFRTLPVPFELLRGTLKYDPAQFVEVFQAFQDFVLGGPRSVQIFMIISNPIQVILFEASGDAEVYNTLIQKFPTPISSTYEVRSYIETIFYAAKNLSGQRFVDGFQFEVPEDLANAAPETSGSDNFKSKSFIFTKILNEVELKKISELVSSKPSNVGFAIESLGGAVNDFEESETAFIHRKGRFAVGQANYRPLEGNENDYGLIWQNEFFNLINEIFPVHESYQNYVSNEFVDPLQRYYGKNLQKLVEVKQKYDPKNYFYNPQSIPVELP